MKPWSVQTVPAGKSPKLKNRQGFYDTLKTSISKASSRIRHKGISPPYYIMACSFILVTALFLQVYLSHNVYVVVLDGKEIGSVRDEEQVTGLINELTESFHDYYGVPVEPGNTIRLVKDYRPETDPDPETVLDTIRQEIIFITDACLIMIDNMPLVPVASEEVLDDVVGFFENAYRNEDNEARIIDLFVVEDLSIRPCSVAPKDLYTGEEVISLLADKEAERPFDSPYWSSADTRSFTGRYQPVHSVIPGSGIFSNPGINVKSIEEQVVVNNIPFEVETIFDEEMWVVQKEISTPGREGEKEIVYQIIRENGLEVERSVVSETVTREPVTQVEVQGTAQVPSKGTGQFMWPVEGGGEVSPGRGFSSWHTGIDIDAKMGTNIVAADNGVVWFSGFGGSQGNYIIIYHGKYWTLYLHNQVNFVQKGAKVNQGDVIARVGSTGRSTGPHLHFEVRRDDGSGEWRAYYQHKPVDPLQYFRP